MAITLTTLKPTELFEGKTPAEEAELKVKGWKELLTVATEQAKP